MSVLAELQSRIESTGELIAQHERTVAETGLKPPPSLLANIRALEKLKRRLEAEYLDVAAQLELEVYKYRILNEAERVTLPGITDAWAGFHRFFAAVYAALTESAKTKTTAKKPVSSQSLELGYGYSFASSVGVAVTVPRELGIFAITPIDDASDTVFDLVEAKNVIQIAASLGPGPIKALHDWVSVHVRNEYGLGLEWHSHGQVKRRTEVQHKSLEKLQTTIGETTTRTNLEVTGKLYSVNEKIKEFGIAGDNEREYIGQFEDAITMEHAAAIPARYRARIVEITKIVVIGKEPKTTYFLDKLEPI